MEGIIKILSLKSALLVFALVGTLFCFNAPGVFSAGKEDAVILRKISKDINDRPDQVEKIVLRVEKPDGDPAVGKQVSFSLISDSLKLLDGPKQVLSDANGIAKYETWGLSGGKYFVVAEVDGQKATFNISIRVISLGFIRTLWLPLLIILALALIVYLFVIKIRSGSVVIDEKTGKGISGVFIEVYDDIGKIVINTATGPSGRFSGNLEKGEYLVKISKSGYRFKRITGHAQINDIQPGARLIISKRSNLRVLMAPSG